MATKYITRRFNLKYQVKQRLNPQDLNGSKKYYATPVYEGTVEFDSLVDRLSRTCTVTPADIAAVLRVLSDELPEYLMEGKSVNLENLGHFRLSFSSKGQERSEDVSANDITNIRVLFKASPKLSKEVQKTNFKKKE